MKIVSNRTGINTHIYDDKGKDITSHLNVTEIDIKITAGDINKVILTCLPENIEFVAEDGEVITRIAQRDKKYCYVKKVDEDTLTIPIKES